MGRNKDPSGIRRGSKLSRTLLMKIVLFLAFCTCFFCLYNADIKYPITYLKDATIDSSLDLVPMERQNITQIHKQGYNDGVPGISENLSNLKTCARRHSVNNTIVITSFDVTYATMALNLYLTSFKRFNIVNHLFVSSDEFGCGKLEPHGAHCIQFANISKTNQTSVFNTPEFKKRVRMKTKIVLYCLEVGLNVLYVDLDIVFLKNPLPAINVCRECDLIAQSEGVKSINSGFYFVKNTVPALQLFREIVLVLSNSKKGEQVAINRLLRQWTGRYKLEMLSPRLFPHGKHFFTNGRRMFAGDSPCSRCVIVHNNYILTLEAKIYRFKEYGLWAVDEDGYYSDTCRQYISYSNPADFGANETNKMETMALKTALIIGRTLNRTVIMPRFHCDGVEGYFPSPDQRCHFAALFSVRTFEAHLSSPDTYRENVFLDHPLVPESTKTSISKVFLIDGSWTQVLRNSSQDSLSDVSLKKPNASGVTDSDIKEWFSSERSRVLMFHSLYNKVITDDKDLKRYAEVVDGAIRKTNFMQI